MTQVELESWLDDAEAQLGSIGLGLDTLEENVDAQRASLDGLQEHMVDRLATLVDLVLKQPDAPAVAEEKTKNPVQVWLLVPDGPVAHVAEEKTKSPGPDGPVAQDSDSANKARSKKSKAKPDDVERLNVSRKQAAFMLGVCEGTIDNYRDAGRLKVTHKGRRVLIPIAEVERLAAEDDPERVRPVGPPGRKPVASVKNPKPLNKAKRS
jgi:hypothetical protein